MMHNDSEYIKKHLRAYVNAEKLNRRMRRKAMQRKVKRTTLNLLSFLLFVLIGE